MSAAIALLLLLLTVPAEAQEPDTASVPRFSQALAAEVFTQALRFMQPRTLERVRLPTLAFWGAGGLSALDPSLSVNLSAGTLHLASPEGPLAVENAPNPRDPAAWGNAIAALSFAAWRSSALVREVGQSGVFKAFFGALFDHFDPYSRYLPPDAAARDRAQRSGRAGAGLLLARKRGGIVIEGVLRGSPAARAGIKPGTRLLSVNYTSTVGESAAAVQDTIAGAAGTRVTLTLFTPRRGIWKVALVRSAVPPETVFSRRRGDMLILRISGFDRTTGPHLANEISAGLSVADPPHGIVLDLRGNRGGLLDQAAYVANVLIRRGTIMTTTGRDPLASHVWYASGTDMAHNLPVVILVNGLSASAAEIVAAALTDDGRAVAVGSSTLGKGLIQAIEPLADSGELFLTWSRVLAPRGWPIQGLGVLPQVCTSLGRLTLERDLSMLAQGIQPLARALYEHDTTRAPVSLAKVLAIRAACPAAVGSAGDLMAAETLIDNPAAYAAALLPPPGRPLIPPQPDEERTGFWSGRRGSNPRP